VDAPAVEAPVAEEAPAKVAKPRGRPRKTPIVEAGDAAPTSDPLATPIATVPPKAEVQPQDLEIRRTDDGNNDETNDGPDGAPRRGWWQRTFGA
jgi:ribonuclease E